MTGHLQHVTDSALPTAVQRGSKCDAGVLLHPIAKVLSYPQPLMTKIIVKVCSRFFYDWTFFGCTVSRKSTNSIGKEGWREKKHKSNAWVWRKKGYKWQVISISAGGAIVLSDRATTNVRLCARGKKKKRRKTKQKKKKRWKSNRYTLDEGWKCSANHRDLSRLPDVDQLSAQLDKLYSRV